MPGQMPPSYFEEKRELSTQSLELVVENAESAIRLLNSLNYTIRDLVSPTQVHDLLIAAAGNLKAARVNYEKARWAAARSNLEFDAWLVNEGQSELSLVTSCQG